MDWERWMKKDLHMTWAEQGWSAITITLESRRTLLEYTIIF
jgi:hypothetical protein